MTTLFERDARFTLDRIRELHAISESERRAHAAIEPRAAETHPGARPRWSLGPALVVAVGLLRVG